MSLERVRSLTCQMNEPTFRTLSIQLSRRSDGGIRVSSEDVPGLILSGSDAQAVIADILPAIEEIGRQAGKDPFKGRD